jgi:hypothetical protein
MVKTHERAIMFECVIKNGTIYADLMNAWLSQPLIIVIQCLKPKRLASQCQADDDDDDDDDEGGVDNVASIPNRNCKFAKR